MVLRFTGGWRAPSVLPFPAKQGSCVQTPHLTHQWADTPGSQVWAGTSEGAVNVYGQGFVCGGIFDFDSTGQLLLGNHCTALQASVPSVSPWAAARPREAPICPS